MSHNDKHTINPEIGKMIKVGSSMWMRLAAKYYMIGNQSTDQVIPYPRDYTASKLNKASKVKVNRCPGKRVANPAGVKRFIVVGNKTWNERYLEYEWNGHEFSGERHRPLLEFMNMVEKRRETRRNKFFALFDFKVAEGRLLDVIDSILGYALTYYHTIDGNMYKEWMNEKRTKKDFRLKNDDDNILWVRLPDGKSEEEVESINLVFDETDEFNEVAKKYILNGMRDYLQCFITIMAYNLMWTQDGELKILNLIDDRLGHLRIIHKNHIDDWLKNYL